MTSLEHGGYVYGDNAGCLDFSANINPLGLSAAVEQALREHLPGVVHYPDPTARELVAALAEHYGVPPATVVLGNGAAELFYLYCQVLRPRRVLLPVPSFSEYERAARSVNAAIVRAPLDADSGFAPNLAALCAHADHVDALLLGNPNNPTGTLLGRLDVERLAATFKAVLFDESFLDFRDDAARHTARTLLARYPGSLVVQSLTKFYAIPGLRLGFALTYNADLAKHLNAAHDPWNVNLLAQVAGVAALRDGDYQRRTRELINRERRFLADELAKLPGVFVYPPTVNFVLLRLAALTATELARRMRERGVLVRDCSNYPGLDDRHLRVAVRSRDENLRLLAAIKSTLGA